MKKSVEDYGNFFDSGDGADDLSKIEALMESVKEDEIYFDEMTEVLEKPQFYQFKIVLTDWGKQYSNY